MALVVLLSMFGRAAAVDWRTVSNAVGRNDSVLVTDASGRILFEKNAEVPRMPASVLKIVTALAAIHSLGADYRFVTEFYKNDAGDLTIKGYGDPLLISEVIAEIAESLKPRLDQIRNIFVDASFFAPVVIPGVTDTLNPYDAPNGALCVNFNTVNFTMKNGRPVSAEPQTPLLPMVIDRIRATGLSHGRIRLSAESGETLLYAGRMFRHFLAAEEIPVTGEVRAEKIQPGRDRLILRHNSPFSLTEVIAAMLAHSSNFMANQLLIAMGAEASGPPGDLKKGLNVAETFNREVLHAEGISMAEGSGISRENRVTANAMLTVLLAFAPHMTLMTSDETGYFKTGSLRGVKSRVGYVSGADGEYYPFVVIHNSAGKDAARTARLIFRALNS